MRRSHWMILIASIALVCAILAGVLCFSLKDEVDNLQYDLYALGSMNAQLQQEIDQLSASQTETDTAVQALDEDLQSAQADEYSALENVTLKDLDATLQQFIPFYPQANAGYMLADGSINTSINYRYYEVTCEANDIFSADYYLTAFTTPLYIVKDDNGTVVEVGYPSAVNTKISGAVIEVNHSGTLYINNYTSYIAGAGNTNTAYAKAYLAAYNHAIAYLPDEIYCAVGTTIELYHDYLCLNWEKYHLQWTCDVGGSFERKYTIMGTAANEGEYPLTLNIYDDNYQIVWTGSTTVKIIDPAISGLYSVTIIGDSNLSGRADTLLPELISLSQSKLTFVGTRWNRFAEGDGIRHEGRAGWSAQSYCSGAAYTYDANGVGTENPFWNPSTSQFDWAYYKTTYSIDPDIVVLALGTNGANVYPRENAEYIKTMVDSIRSNDATIPIYVLNAPYYGSQDGIGLRMDADGFNTFSGVSQFEQYLKMFNLMVYMNDLFDGYTDFYFVPFGLCLDTQYNMGTTTVQVNSRNPLTEDMPGDVVHFGVYGALQQADILYSTIAGTIETP